MRSFHGLAFSFTWSQAWDVLLIGDDNGSLVHHWEQRKDHFLHIFLFLVSNIGHLKAKVTFIDIITHGVRYPQLALSCQLSNSCSASKDAKTTSRYQKAFQWASESVYPKKILMKKALKCFWGTSFWLFVSSFFNFWISLVWLQAVTGAE